MDRSCSLNTLHAGAPSTSVTEINARQSLVAFFNARPFLRQDLAQCLLDSEDTSRIVQKLLLGRGSFPDLTAICSTIDTWKAIKDRILMEKQVVEGREEGPVDETEWTSIHALMDRMANLEWLANRIRSSLVLREGNLPEGAAFQEDLSPGSVVPAAVRDYKNPLGLTEWTIKPE